MQRSIDYEEPSPIEYIYNTSPSVKQLNIKEYQGRDDGQTLRARKSAGRLCSLEMIGLQYTEHFNNMAA